MEKFDNRWHTEHGLRECEDQPQVYSLSGILMSLKNKSVHGTDAPIDIGWGAPAFTISFNNGRIVTIRGGTVEELEEKMQFIRTAIGDYPKVKLLEI